MSGVQLCGRFGGVTCTVSAPPARSSSASHIISTASRLVIRIPSLRIIAYTAARGMHP